MAGQHDGGLYPYRIRGRERSGLVVWVNGTDGSDDRVLTEPGTDGPRVPIFVTGRQATARLRRGGLALETPEYHTLELERVQHWLADPARRRPPWGEVLCAWNFFEDLARGLSPESGTAVADLLPAQGPVHDSAYHAIFEAPPDRRWTPAEQRAVIDLLTAGTALWNTCPIVRNPRW
ncbi:hypothetical protein [Kitasatospora paranensis]|uniref:Uncharacterized protein n=1 Tax=Kitasatospora paranensis TaxID=258053 RepID=A0ABW2G6S9_9ACTN